MRTQVATFYTRSDAEHFARLLSKHRTRFTSGQVVERKFLKGPIQSCYEVQFLEYAEA